MESLQPFTTLPRSRGKSKDWQCTISATTLHGWKVSYVQELAKNDHRWWKPKSYEAACKMLGRPLLLGDKLDAQVEAFLK